MTPPLHADPGAFAGLGPDASYVDARFVVLPLPYDETASFQKGAAHGPAAVLEVSPQLEMYDIETGTEPYRAGIVTAAPVAPAPTPAGNVERIREAAARIIADGKTVVGLGGDHSVTIGLVQAHAAAYPGLTVLQLDAHTDTRNEYEGTPFSHACVMARVAERCNYLQVGIRAMDRAETARLRPDRTFFAHDHDEPAVLEAVRTRLASPLYITVDIDVLDPAEMPATGTPEPGGLRYRQLVNVLRQAFRHHQVVGFDVVELMPLPGHRAPEFLVARLLYQMMAFQIYHRPA